MPQQKQVVTPKSPSGSGDFFSGLFAGAVIGAAAYYLFATDEGKKTKEELIHLSKKYLKELEETAQDLKSTLPNVKDTIKLPEIPAPVPEEPDLPSAPITQVIEQKVTQQKEELKEKIEEEKLKFEEMKKKTQETKKELNKELKMLETSVEVARKKADQMQDQLEKAASRIERKFFVRKGKSLRK
jgi:gas vesicle protein